MPLCAYTVTSFLIPVWEPQWPSVGTTPVRRILVPLRIDVLEAFIVQTWNGVSRYSVAGPLVCWKPIQ